MRYYKLTVKRFEKARRQGDQHTDAVAQREMNPANFTLSRSSSILIIRKRHAH